MRQSMILVFATALAAALLPAQTVSGFAEFRAPLSASAENLPVTTAQAAGEATVLVHTQRNAAGELQRALVDFKVDYVFGQDVTLVAMHIHRGDRGVNGPVVIDSQFNGSLPVAAGTGSLFRQNDITDPALLAVVEDLLANPSGFYVNLHSTSSPAGLMRGQVEPVASTLISENAQELQTLREEHAALAAELAAARATINRIAFRLGITQAQ